MENYQFGLDHFLTYMQISTGHFSAMLSEELTAVYKLGNNLETTKGTVISIFVYTGVTCLSNAIHKSILDHTVNSAAETPADRESPERVSRVMSVASEPKSAGESPTKSREAPLPAHTTSGMTRFTVFCSAFQ